jgi:hypothetical protein
VNAFIGNPVFFAPFPHLRCTQNRATVDWRLATGDLRQKIFQPMDEVIMEFNVGINPANPFIFLSNRKP